MGQHVSSWLELQCRMIEDVRVSVVLLGTPDQGPFIPVAVWPNAKQSINHLTSAAERSLKERRGLLIRNDSSQDPENTFPESYHVAYPIEVSGKLHGVVVLEVGPRPKQELQAVLRQLHWGAAWLELLMRREDTADAASNERLQTGLNLVVSAVEHEGFHPAAMAFVTGLATSLECDRVSLGFVEKNHVRVSALSHSADFGKQMNVMCAIGSAMDEAIDQNARVVYPLSSEDAPLIVRAHEELA